MTTIEIMFLIALPIFFILVGYLVRELMGKRIRNRFEAIRTKHIRKTNPCYRCPSSRKYVCDGCFRKLRKEYENGQRK